MELLHDACSAVLGGGDDADKHETQPAKQIPVARRAEDVLGQVVEQDDHPTDGQRGKHEDGHQERRGPTELHRRATDTARSDYAFFGTWGGSSAFRRNPTRL